MKLPHGLYYPRVSLQTKEDDILMHTKATMCRNKEYKYIKRAYEKDEFYDLKKDPGEMNNLINDLKYDQIENKLRDEATKLKKQYKYNPNRDWWLKQVMKTKKNKQKS